MNPLEQKLTTIASQLKNGVSPPTVRVDEFVGWFGATRRGWRVVSAIRSELARRGIATVPDFEGAWYYSYVAFAKANTAGTDEISDPTVRLSGLQAANKPPAVVAPGESLQRAVSQMIAKDYSQLPVMSGTREVKGLISWRSIGTRLALGKACTLVHECMDVARILPSNASLFDALAAVAADDCVLVQAPDKTICGIVTATDLNEQFLQLAEPFLLVGEIERGVRFLLHGKFSAAELKAARFPGDERDVDGISDLSLGEYVRLLQDDERWKKLSVAFDKKEFCTGLDRVREIRNDVMHFNPDGIDALDMERLREFSKYLRRLRTLGAV